MSGEGAAGSSKMMTFLLIAFLLLQCMSGSRDVIRATADGNSVTQYDDNIANPKVAVAAAWINKKRNNKAKNECSSDSDCKGICPVKCIDHKCKCP
ncbi:hypothetical protein LINGRAHAP2_LOCUS10147 [Linum grandiflorum]